MKERAFSMIELLVAVEIFLMSLLLMAKQVEMFRKSYGQLRENKHILYTEAEIDRFIGSYLQTACKSEKLESSICIVDNCDISDTNRPLKTLKARSSDQGNLLIIHSLVGSKKNTIQEEYPSFFFILHNFITGNHSDSPAGMYLDIDLARIKNVDGYFVKKGKCLEVHYHRLGEEKERVLIYDLPEED